jgi:hypothetical protein
MALGYFMILEKSAGIKVIPMPNMIMANDNGKSTLEISSAMDISW